MRVVIGACRRVADADGAMQILVAAAEAAFEKMRTDKRLAELEAKLAQAREWAERDSERVDLLDILDRKEGA